MSAVLAADVRHRRRWRRAAALAGRLGTSTRGAVAIEFAFVAPITLLLFFGGYAVSQCVSISRKVTITTRALADLTTQFATLSATDLNTVMNATSEVIAPFDPGPLALRLSQITTDSTGLVATVSWSTGRNLSPYATGSTFTLPTSMQTPNANYIYSEIQYNYAPLTTLVGTSIMISDHIFMLPRLSSSIAYSG